MALPPDMGCSQACRPYLRNETFGVLWERPGAETELQTLPPIDPKGSGESNLEAHGLDLIAAGPPLNTAVACGKPYNPSDDASQQSPLTLPTGLSPPA